MHKVTLITAQLREQWILQKEQGFGRQ